VRGERRFAETKNRTSNLFLSIRNRKETGSEGPYRVRLHLPGRAVNRQSIMNFTADFR
jgi:hypothetical protein